LKIPGSDGRTYEIAQKGDSDDYEVTHDGKLMGGFRLESGTTPTWVSDAGKGTVTNRTLEKLADTFVERGGGAMRMM
jgi:hypothetical protein